MTEGCISLATYESIIIKPVSETSEICTAEKKRLGNKFLESCVSVTWLIWCANSKGQEMEMKVHFAFSCRTEPPATHSLEPTFRFLLSWTLRNHITTYFLNLTHFIQHTRLMISFTWIHYSLINRRPIAIHVFRPFIIYKYQHIATTVETS